MSRREEPRWHKADMLVVSQGKQAVVAILGGGEFFGEGCLNGQSLRLATARAMAESEVMRITKASSMPNRPLPKCS